MSVYIAYSLVTCNALCVASTAREARDKAVTDNMLPSADYIEVREFERAPLDWSLADQDRLCGRGRVVYRGAGMHSPDRPTQYPPISLNDAAL